jgi:hypothetical protein
MSLREQKTQSKTPNNLQEHFSSNRKAQTVCWNNSVPTENTKPIAGAFRFQPKTSNKLQGQFGSDRKAQTTCGNISVQIYENYKIFNKENFR